MWSISKAAGISSIKIYRNLSANQLVKACFCKVKTELNTIPYEIKYAQANKKLTEYIENLKEKQSIWLHQNSPSLNCIVELYANRLSIVNQYKELMEEMANETASDIIALANEEKQKFRDLLSEIDAEIIDEIIAMNDNEPDVDSIMFEVQAGVGGQEAMLFAREIFCMYENYIKFKKWDHNVLEEDFTDLGGIRKASILVRGYSAYSLLKHEAGVHRVQRVPKTERAGRMHTSTAVIAVVPCADEIKIKLNPNDLRIETKRSSGPGGQNVNKLESAVRIVHIPTGIAVECQEERTQVKNKQIAMKKLHNRLYQMEFTKQVSSQLSARKSQVGLRTRNEKLRTYNYTQNRITDHRINGPAGTVHNLEELLSGTDHLDDFILNINKSIQRQKLDEILDQL